ncbi:DUF599 domain-containing protein [Pseudooceanicola sp. CBS1P-1]|uniref:DUF599 family protein n=1 Tax=Pseudooceanicola albus TaxID=2692189 RepID=A0A6L7FY03_9RHOB|nr:MULTISPECIES: DUF599 domain-containing protein [Pseudooceanicola]MBT9384029.1 DUF599 domain-containing protein [Pseudooceanicola endophyticus]MXN16559.1 DUF599 family protein [Pseudooceanicola albus]
MTALDFISHFSRLDMGMVLLMLALWGFTGWRIEHPSPKRPSVSHLMAEYRREWLRMMAERNPRIFDSQILSTLRANSSFFASSTMIAIGGVLALLGNSGQLRSVASDLGVSRSPEVAWEVKLMLIAFFLVNAFLKFVWANRLFGYCGVLMGAIPNTIADPRTLPRALKAAQINIFAARSFNRGLRAIYFALAATGWFLGPWGLLTTTLITCLMLWRREFASQSRELLLQREGDEV